MLEKANSLPLSSLCIKEAPDFDRLPTMWNGIDRWPEHHGRRDLNVGHDTLVRKGPDDALADACRQCRQSTSSVPVDATR
jgi:hypothetical protein